MKKLLLLLTLFVLTISVKAQFSKPTGAVVIPVYSFFRNPADSAITIYQGSVNLYNTFVQHFDTVKLSGWVNNRKLLKYRLIGDSILKDGTASNYKLLHKIDSIMALVKYRNDTVVITGYATRGYVQRNFVAKNDSSKLYELKSNKVTSISGASTDIQYPSAKLLNDKLALYSSGTGTDGYIPNWHGTNTFELSPLFTNGTYVGINTTGPQSTLDVQGLIGSSGANSGFKFMRRDTNAQTWIMYSPSGTNDIRFFDGSDRITFQNGGNVGIGTISPTYPLHVNGTAYVSSSITTPIINLTTGAAVNKIWQCTNATTGAGQWATVSTTQTFISTWDASSNTPTLADGSGTAGYFHQVNVGGTQNLGSGSITYEVGDQIIYNGSIWQKIPKPIITGLALTKTDDTNVTLTLGGSPSTALLTAASLTLGWTGTLADGRIASATNWNTAYGWGNHASAGYGLASALSTHAGLTTTAHGLGASAFHADSYFQTALTNPITGTGASGQVSFWTGTNIQSGDDGLFWDNTNKRLGIGTTTPGSLLDIMGDNNQLHINTTGTYASIYFKNTNVVTARIFASAGNFRVQNTGTGFLSFSGGGGSSDDMVILDNSSALIGYTSDPTSGNKFAVNGTSYFNGAISTVSTGTSTDWNAKQASLTFGIANTNSVVINSADVADNDYAKFTATGLEGRSYAEVLSDIGAQPAGSYVAVSDTSTMLGKYTRKVSPTFTGTVVLPSTTSIGTITNTELGYVDGVTSAIQTQFTGKEPTITAGTTSQYWRGDKTWQTLPTAGTGTVTSVAMSVPTGLSISGTPITTSGTLALTLTSGYVIPTTTNISNLNTAYGWGNHASAGYLTTNLSVQALSGTSVSWNCASGINATLTLSGTTTVTLSNVATGTSGNIKVTNPSGAANSLTFALSGKTVLISPAVYVSSGRVLTSGSSKVDMFSWYYDNTNLIINGSNDYR